MKFKAPRSPAVNVGNEEHPVYVAPELCEVLPGQIANKKLNPAQTREMIRFAVRPPGRNADLILGEGVDVMGIGPGHPDGPV